MEFAIRDAVVGEKPWLGSLRWVSAECPCLVTIGKSDLAYFICCIIVVELGTTHNLADDEVSSDPNQGRKGS